MRVRRELCRWRRSGEEWELLTRGEVIARVVRDGEWLTMWRVVLPDGSVSDMVNLTRAKDAAIDLAAAVAEKRPGRTAAA